jgi:ferredoxin-NADP reductase
MSEISPVAAQAHWQSGSIYDIVPQTPRVKSFFFDLPRPLMFTAGQHVDVRLTAPDGYRAMRSYSIASSPEVSTKIELAIELLDNGEVSPFFHDVVRVGDAIDLRGPLGGHFIWTEKDGGPLLLLGGGSGVVPLMCMLRHRKAVNSDVSTLLLLSARTWEDVLFRDELLQLAERQDGFRLVLALTRDAPRRKSDYGRRVDPAMMAEVLMRIPSPPRLVYACGANQFVDSAVDSAIQAGIPQDIIRTERYGV